MQLRAEECTVEGRGGERREDWDHWDLPWVKCSGEKSRFVKLAGGRAVGWGAAAWPQPARDASRGLRHSWAGEDVGLGWRLDLTPGAWARHIASWTDGV